MCGNSGVELALDVDDHAALQRHVAPARAREVDDLLRIWLTSTGRQRELHAARQ
jgi:hypothetical protein